MTALAEKLKDAGVDTVGAKLTAACVEAIRRHPESVVNAWRFAGETFGHEFIRGLMGDMQLQAAYPPHRSVLEVLGIAKTDEIIARTRNHPANTPTPYVPRVTPPERLEKCRELQAVIRSKYLHSGGGAWSEVSWHALQGMKRDGAEAVALIAAGPGNVPNDGRTVGDVLGIKRVDEIVEKVRKLGK